jgi:hypothetical protein
MRKQEITKNGQTCESYLKIRLKKWNKLFSLGRRGKSYLKVPDEKVEEDISDEHVGVAEGEERASMHYYLLWVY